MRLQQKKYFFSYKEKNDKIFSFENEEDLILSLTDKINPESKLTLEKSFIEINSFSKNEIKGYSIIEKLIEDGCKIFDKENNEIILIKKQNPIIQLSDDDLEDVEYQEFFDKLKEMSPIGDDGKTPETDKPPVDGELPYSYSEKFTSTKEKLEKLKYVFSEIHIENLNGGFFYKENNHDENKLILYLGDLLEIIKTEKISDDVYEAEDIKITILDGKVNVEKTTISA